LRHEPQREPDSAVHILLSGGGGRRLRRRYLHAIGSARHRILLAQSYFLPDHGLLRSLTAAARRGVAVTLLVPGVSDVPLARATTALVYQRLLAAGVQLFELSATILHAKLGVFDDDRVLVGSFNLDPYSLADLEVLVDAHDGSAAASAAAWIERHLSAALPITDPRARGGAIRRFVEHIKGELGLWLARAIGRMMARR
jgi:cardiolipin synthase